MKVGHSVVPFSANRRMAVASAAIAAERNTIHGITAVDISEPRRLMREHKGRTGETLSLIAHLVACLARAVAENDHAIVDGAPAARFVKRLSEIMSGGRMLLA